jgi:WhiB family redox-sensing transcriptional regulator
MTSPYLEYPDFFNDGDPICASTDPDIFFPDYRLSDRSKEVKDAKAVCTDCPYKLQCLAWALKYEDIGIWGGTTERERRLMKQKTSLYT